MPFKKYIHINICLQTSVIKRMHILSNTNFSERVEILSTQIQVTFFFSFLWFHPLLFFHAILLIKYNFEKYEVNVIENYATSN